MSSQYFELARNEEKAGNECAALLLYLSSFCSSFNSGEDAYPYGTVAKICWLQNRLSLSECQLVHLVHSYGPFSDEDCRALLLSSIRGDLDGIRCILLEK